MEEEGGGGERSSFSGSRGWRRVSGGEADCRVVQHRTIVVLSRPMPPLLPRCPSPPTATVPREVSDRRPTKPLRSTHKG